MLIIGHRGAAGTRPENTLQGLRAGLNSDADILEFDVRLSKDKVPILLHDMHLWRTHRLPYLVNRLTYNELTQRTAGSLNPIVSLNAVIAEFSGRLMLNLELKDRGCAKAVMPMLARHIKRKSDWDKYLISSLFVSELKACRKFSPDVHLALLEWYNPLRFITADKQLNLAAVGFHRLHVNRLVIGAAKKLKLFTYAYTVNRPQAAKRLQQLGVDAVVTDYPNLIKKELR